MYSLSALSAEHNLKKTNTAERRRVQKSAQPRYVSISEITYIGKEDVYNMEVRYHHNFSCCGGFIMHNCMDAIRYAVMGMWKHLKHWLPETEDERE